MMQDEMTLTRFEELADAYGGDLTCWPEELRASAGQFADAEPAARDVLAQAAALDALLDADAAPAPSDALMARVLADAGAVAAERAESAAAARAEPATTRAGAAGESLLTALFGDLRGWAGPALAGAVAIAIVGGATVGGTTQIAANGSGASEFDYAMSDETTGDGIGGLLFGENG